jgi:hypothetical protein
MAADLNTPAFWIMAALFAALGVASMIEGSKPQATKGENYFGLLYLVFAVGLIIYKMMGH